MQEKGRKTQRKSVQSSRHSAALTAAAKEALQKAKECYREIDARQRSALLKAREAGEWFEKARVEIKKNKGAFRSILRSETKEFGKNSLANVYNYIKIFENWAKIEKRLKEEPDLSIDGALRFLRTGESKEINQMNVAAEKLYAEIVAEGMEEWSDAERTWLSTKYAEVIDQMAFTDMLRPVFAEVRKKVQQAMKGSKP